MRIRLLCSVLVFAVTLCQSQTKTYMREYTYMAGEADSKITARAVALEQVKRILLEEVGVYIHSKLETSDWERREGKEWKSGSLTERQTTALTAGVTETKILEEKWNGAQFYIRAQIVVDTTDVVKKIRGVLEKEGRLAELEESRKRADSALVEIKRLQNELKKAKSESEKVGIVKQVAVETMGLNATEWFERAYTAGIRGQVGDAISFYTRAIELKPDYAEAYNNRGVAKDYLKDYSGAIADYTKVIELKPDYAVAYSNRGSTKLNLRDYSGAIADYTKAIELKPDDREAYRGRGSAKGNLQDYSGAAAV